MANIQTITVDMDKLEKLFNNCIACHRCPFGATCKQNGRTCAQDLLEYVQPEKEYYITARVIYDLGYRIKARSEDEAIKKIRKELQEKCSNEENCSFDILDWGVVEDE